MDNRSTSCFWAVVAASTRWPLSWPRARAAASCMWRPATAARSRWARTLRLTRTTRAAVADFARGAEVGLVVIGPEARSWRAWPTPCARRALLALARVRPAPQMEGSKKFSKELMARAGIPTAAYGSFTNEESALAYVREQGAPVVVKADGLAAGKGVVVAATLEEAEEAVRACFAGAFWRGRRHRGD